jgi:serine/threonine-protein phosphatase 2A regulatory subunit B
MENNILAAPQGYYVFSSYNLVVTSDVMILFAHISSAVDIISAIEFDKSGDHLATGDRGGRVVLFERTDTKDHGGSRKDLEQTDYPVRHPEFRYKTEFQSHEPEFDYLKSLEIEEKINKIRWCQPANGALFLLSTNDKTIKYWKVQEKKIKKISEMNIDPSESSNIPPQLVTNGLPADKGHDYLSKDFSFPPGGIPSLRLPVVVVLDATFFYFLFGCQMK